MTTTTHKILYLLACWKPQANTPPVSAPSAVYAEYPYRCRFMTRTSYATRDAWLAQEPLEVFRNPHHSVGA
jgi:hypothetical protein